MSKSDKNHNHSHQDQSKKNIKIAFFINFIFSISEFFFGFLFNSVSIMSDAVHDLGDSISIGFAWFFQGYSEKKQDERFTFGYNRFSLLGALITGVVLISGSFFMIYRSVPRLLDPQPVNYSGMFWLSLVAIALNGYAAWILSKGTSKNEGMLNLHMLEDVLGYYSIMNKVKRFRNYKDGFTIIEVVLVLAIAGLIFLMVFIALPALQRSQRDMQRKRDADRFLAAIQSYQSNNRGRLPEEIDHSAPINSYSNINSTNFGRNYLRQDGYFNNPEGTVYVIYTSTRVNPGETLPDNAVNDFWLARGAECDGEDLRLTVANNWASLRNVSNRVAIRIKLEGGGIYCVNN